MRRGGTVAYCHRPHAFLENRSIRAVIVAHEELRSRVPWKGFGDLVRQPRGGRPLGDFDMQDLAPVMAEHDERVKAFERKRRYGEHIDGNDFLGVVAQKRPPALPASGGARQHVFRDGGLGDIKAELEQFAVDVRRAPQGILVIHAADKIDQGAVDAWPAGTTAAGFPSPPGAKSGAVPAYHGLRCHKDKGIVRRRHSSVDPDKDGAIRIGQTRLSFVARDDQELVAQQGVFCPQLHVRAKNISVPPQEQAENVQRSHTS
jgi:hypothetical protein